MRGAELTIETSAPGAPHSPAVATARRHFRHRESRPQAGGRGRTWARRPERPQPTARRRCSTARRTAATAGRACWGAGGPWCVAALPGYLPRSLRDRRMTASSQPLPQVRGPDADWTRKRIALRARDPESAPPRALRSWCGKTGRGPKPKSLEVYSTVVGPDDAPRALPIWCTVPVSSTVTSDTLVPASNGRYSTKGIGDAAATPPSSRPWTRLSGPGSESPSLPAGLRLRRFDSETGDPFAFQTLPL